MTLCNLNFLACWTALASVYSAFGGITNGYVYPRIIDSRSDDAYLELIINDNIHLNLEKASPFADTFRVIYENEGANFVEELNAESLSGEIYKDTKQKAALLISRKNGLRARGVIQGNLIIDHDDEALVKNGLVSHRLNIRQRTARTEYHHDVSGSERFHESFGKRNKARLNERLLTYSGPKHATVETMLVLEQEYFSEFKKSNHSKVVSVIEYMAVFMAMVNAVFEEFDKKILDIQLSVGSIVLLKGNSQTFLHTIPQKGDVIKGSTLQSFNEFVKKHESVLGKQDIVVFISNYTVDTGKVHHSNTHYTAGYATVGGACTENPGCLVKDDPKTFEGVYTLVHEALHLLGVVHDGNEAPSYLSNSPGARRCNQYSSTVMAAVSHPNVELSLSECTEKQVVAYLESQRGSCLLSPAKRNSRPIKTKVIQSVFLNTAQFCGALVPEASQVKFVKELDENINIQKCYAVCSWSDKNYIHYRYQPAPPYTFCGENIADLKVCLHGKCSAIKTSMRGFSNEVRKILDESIN